MYLVFIFCSCTFKVVKLLRWIVESYLIRCCRILLYLFEVPFFVVSFISFFLFYQLFSTTCSEKTDLESTHSSNVSGYHSAEKQYNIQQHQSVIPPDALYTTNEKIVMTQNPSPHPYNNQQFGYEADFNDSKVSLSNI